MQCSYMKTSSGSMKTLWLDSMLEMGSDPTPFQIFQTLLIPLMLAALESTCSKWMILISTYLQVRSLAWGQNPTLNALLVMGTNLHYYDM